MLRLLFAIFSIFCALLAHKTANAQAVWTTVNIGSPLLGGGSTSFPCQSTACPSVAIQTSAVGWGATDELTFIHQPLIDDGAVVAKIVPPSTGGRSSGSVAAAVGGLSVRAGLEPAAAAVALAVTPQGKLILHSRAVKGGTTSSTVVAAVSSPLWLKIERRGTLASVFHSPDGAQWTAAGQATFASARTVYVGVVAASGDSNAMLTTAATDLHTTSLSTLPAGWSAADVGGSGTSASTTYQQGSHVVVNTAGAIGDSADRFGFAHVRVSGDAELVARVMSPGRAGASQAGIMVRESLLPDAAHVFVGVAAPSTRLTRRRIGEGLPTISGPTRAVSAGWWLKLVRQGALVSTFESSNGVAWTPVSTDALALPGSFYVGLAFAAGTGSAQGVFEQVSVQALAANKPPLVAVQAPAAGTTVYVGDKVTLVAAASDPDDRVDAVEFLVNGTRVGIDTAAPYQAIWTASKTGTYQLTAVAIDSEGARTATIPLPLTVVAPVPAGSGASREPTSPTKPSPSVPALPGISPKSWKVEFKPSSDHSKSVSRYVLQVFNAKSLLMLTLDLGRPAVVNGTCTVDVSNPLTALLAGTYVASVRAVDDAKGLSSSAATATFTR